MDSAKENVGCAIAGFAYAIMGILGVVIHVWTIVIAYAVSGLLGAGLSLVFPVFAQIYWFIMSWHVAGTVLNNYCLAILAFIGCYILMAIGIKIAESESMRPYFFIGIICTLIQLPYTIVDGAGQPILVGGLGHIYDVICGVAVLVNMINIASVARTQNKGMINLVLRFLTSIIWLVAVGWYIFDKLVTFKKIDISADIEN